MFDQSPLTPDTMANTPWSTSQLPPTKRHHRVPWLIVGVAAILLMIIIIVIALVSPHGNACLDANDYKTLTGTPYGDDGTLRPSDSFYTTPLEFDESKASLTNDSKASLDKMVDFYRSHHSHKSIVITLSATYANNAALMLVQQRINTTETTLVKNGVPSDAIHFDNPQYVMAEDGSASVNPSDGEVVLSITSEATCK